MKSSVTDSQTNSIRKWSTLQRVPSRTEDWELTFSIVKAKSIGHGGSGTVFAIDQSKVIKVFSGDTYGKMDLEREKDIFETLQSREFSKLVVNFKYQWTSGLVLERLESTLRQRLVGILPPSQPPLALQWVQECSAAVKFIHSHNVIHGDLGCQNFLVDSDEHVKLCDFAGSRLGDLDAWIAYEVRSQHPKYSGQQPTIKTEIFALGSVFFEIYTSRPPFPSASNLVIRQKFFAGEFPIQEVPDPDVRHVIQTCWAGEYENVSDICSALENVGKLR
ncbi:Serine/threonine-protein kinase RUNKEL [Lachnellula arida]|uniref:Serine/threonine-protein kinase RUNKEL n=1 Tax=Lachnellula arida TaxID=1316785 RepID=A0A8T9BGB7_9HELO|nr:Serine/threonine-protein kinase RUNKEL [Lachnellula arida]